MKRFVSLFFLQFILWSTYAQNAVQLPEIIPPSPNVASLGKYVETPVSSASGIPKIIIPLYTIKEGDISVPISLSYHAGGIKVEEIASWVGLGWALNAGGVVSRSTRGLADDCSSKGYMHTTYTVEHFAGLAHIEGGENRFYQIQQMSLGYRDYEPDIFTFNFGQYSGRFMYDQTADQFIQMPFSNLRIEHVLDSAQRIESFVITTPDGFKYYFGKGRDGVVAVDFNYSTSNFTYSSNTFGLSDSTPVCDHITAWHLKEIVSPSKRSVRFNYQKRLTRQLYKTQESLLPDNSCSVSGYSANFSETFAEVSHLQNIEFTDGKVEFMPASLDRLDFKGTKALSGIKIYKGATVLKTYDLAHDYFVSSPENGKWASLGDAEERRHRLKLLSVREISSSGESLPPYTFTYNTIGLPNRFSNAQDYWGYYNSKNENKELIPEVRLPYTPAIYVGDADRTVDVITSKAGMLKKITYPTGGIAEYFFESNTASDVISKESKYDLKNRGEIIKFYFVKAPANYDSSFFMYAKNFTIGPEILGQVEVITSVTGCDNSATLSNFECDYLLEIQGITDPNFNLDISSSYFTYEFPPGEYRITAMEAGNGGSIDPHFSTSMKWEEDIHAGYLVAGGQRIQKIILTDGKGDTIEKIFSYDFFGQDLTSGYIISSPLFVDSQYYNSSCDPDKDVFKITSNSQAPLANVNGGHVGYKQVTEFQKGIIKTESTFSKVGDLAHFSAGTYGKILLPDLYSGWLRGNLIKKDEFSYENGTYELVKTTSIEMESYSRHSIPNHGVTVIPTINDTYFTFKYGFYSGISEWYRPKRTVVTNVFGDKQVVQESTHFYGSNSLLPSRTEVKTSNNGMVATNFYYPFDVGTNGAVGTITPLSISPTALTAVTNLKTENRIAIPIQVETFKGSSKTAVRTNYNTISGLTLPEAINTAKATESFENRLRYNRYDDNGNPLEIFREDGPTVAYIWGYDGQFPVAKVEKATYAQIESLSYFGSGFTLGSGGLSANQENSLRTGLPNAMTTTYTYEPMVGVTSVTDPKGYTIFYEYDAFNRLEFVKDAAGNILSENEYNFKGSSN